MTTIRGNLAASEADNILETAPWPALVLTQDGRILQWNAAAGAALDPVAEGLTGLRLSYALEDQGLCGAGEMRLAIAPEDACPDAPAEIALLDLGGGGGEARGLGAGLTGILGDAVEELVDIVADQPGLSAAESLGRALAAILVAASTPSPKVSEPRCSIAAVAARLLESRRPRFVAQRRNLTVTVDCEAPEEAAIPDAALGDGVAGVLDLIAADTAFGDASVRAGPDSQGKALRVDISARASGKATAPPRALDLLAMLARLHLGPYGGDATLATPQSGDAMLLRLRAPAGSRLKAQAAAVRPGLPDLSHVSILMAEDNLTNQLVAAEMLKSMRARLVIASDGVEAMEKVRDGLYDILLVDIEMPRLSGLEVIRRVRAMESPQAGRPIVALTAYAMNEHRARIMAAGADGLIPKPILSIEEFGRTILNYLSGDAPASPKADPAAAPAAQTSRDGLVEIAIFNALTNAIGPDATEELLDKVSVDLADVRAEIDRSAAAGDMEGMRQATHILVSVAGAIGAVRLQKMAEQMNRLAHDGDPDQVRAAAPGALTELGCLLDFVGEQAGASP